MDSLIHILSNNLILENHILLLFKTSLYNSRKQEKVTLRKLIRIITQVKDIAKESAGKDDNNYVITGNRGKRSQMFFKIGVLKSLAIFTRKHLCWNRFLAKLQASLALSCKYCENFKDSIFYRTPPVAASVKALLLIKVYRYSEIFLTAMLLLSLKASVLEEVRILCVMPQYQYDVNTKVQKYS